MRSQFLSALVAVAAVPSTVIASSAPKPGTCIRDDLFLRINSADKAERREVKAFCRDYLGIPVATWYSTTVTPTETIQSTATASTTVIETTTVTSVETVVSTSVETTVVSTATYTIEGGGITARDAQHSSLPESLVAEYKPAALSSACSCLSLRKCTQKGGVFTASPTTTTVASTLTVETTSVTSITEAATTTTGTTVTTDITTTTSVEPPAPTFTSFGAVVTFPGDRTKYYLVRLRNAAGDVFYLSTDITKAVKFRIDSLQRLVYDSASFAGQATYVYYNTNWLSQMNTYGLIGARPAAGVAGLKENEVPFQFDDRDAHNLQVVGPGAALQLQLAKMLVDPMPANEWYLVYANNFPTSNPQWYSTLGSFKAEYF